MDAQTTLSKIMVALGMNQEEATEVKLAEMKLEDGTKIEAEEFQAGQAVFVITEDKEKMAMPEGSYAMEDGKVMVVDESGVIAEVMEPKKEEAESEEKEEAVTAGETEEIEAANDGEAQAKKVVESETISRETFFAEVDKVRAEFTAQLEAYKEEIANLSSQKEQAELQLSTTEKDLAEVQSKLNAEPASTGVKHSPEGNTAAKSKFNKIGNNSSQNTASRVFAKIANIKNV